MPISALVPAATRPFRGLAVLGALASLCVLAACAADAAVGEAITVRDSSGVAIVENDLLRLDATCTLGDTPTLSIGEEDGDENYLLSSVSGARRLSDGRIVLANARSWQVRYYGADGKFIRSSGRRGEGPGEFRQPFTLHTLPGDTVYVGDIRPFRFLVFAPDGEWLSTIDAKPMMINSPAFPGVLDDGRMVLGKDDDSRFEGDPTQFRMQTLTMQLHARDGTLLDTIVTLENGRYGMPIPENRISVRPFFESYPHVNADADRIVLGHGAERELRVLDTGEGTPLTRLVRWTGESREVTSADVDGEKAREKAQFEQFGGEAKAPPFLRSAYETHTHSSRPVAEVMPAMNGIRLGTDGRIWIREFYKTGDTLPRNWIGFDEEGRFVCRLKTPRFAGFEEFGADYLLVVDEDSLGVERVRSYPLTK